jgi:hypothetical protein
MHQEQPLAGAVVLVVAGALARGPAAVLQKREHRRADRRRRQSFQARLKGSSPTTPQSTSL